MFLYLIVICLQLSVDLSWTVLYSIIKTMPCLLLLISISLSKRTLTILLSRYNKIDISSNKCILITGATSGIGLALARFYHKLGFTIFACYYNDKEAGYGQLSKLNSQFGRIYFISMDISSSQSIQKARKDVDTILLGNTELRLYCLVNNAGVGAAPIHLAMESRKTIERVCDTNLRGQLLTIREFMSLLIKGQGRIVNVSSGLAMFPLKLSALYGSSKAAIYQMSRCIQYETEQYGVKTIVLLPGNAMKNTNIYCGLLNNIEQSWEEFDKDERLIYNRLFKRYKDYTKSESERLEKMRQGDASARPFDALGLITLSPKQSKSCRDHHGGRQQQHNNMWWAKFFNEFKLNYLPSILDNLGGAPKTHHDNLEDDSFLEAFDDAIRSKNPQSVLFPGNRWFQFFSGPIVRLMPQAFIDFVLSYSKGKIERNLEAILKSIELHETIKLE